MTAPAAAAPARGARQPGPFEVALYAIGFALAGLVVMALLWSGGQPYRDLARDNGVRANTFVLHSAEGGTSTMDVNAIVALLHEPWSRYVTGGQDEPPRFERPLFTGEEYAHMADVRRIFDLAKLLVPVGLFVMLVRLRRARASSGAAALRVARDGSVAAAAVVAAIGAATVFAFEPLFLLFHELFFPQGNYLFDPATSNLVRLYPDWYWEGITLRVGVSFVAVALTVALVTALALRRAK